MFSAQFEALANSATHGRVIRRCPGCAGTPISSRREASFRKARRARKANGRIGSSPNHRHVSNFFSKPYLDIGLL